MLKLIPIIIIPFSFFLIFLGVKNLTDKFESFSDSQQNENSAQNSFTNEKIINNSHVNSSNDLASDNNPTKNKIHLNDNSYSNIDAKEEMQRLDKKISKLIQEKEMLGSKLSNKSFVENAPKDLVESQKDRFSVLSKELENLDFQMDEIKKMI